MRLKCKALFGCVWKLHFYPITPASRLDTTFKIEFHHIIQTTIWKPVWLLCDSFLHFQRLQPSSSFFLKSFHIHRLWKSSRELIYSSFFLCFKDQDWRFITGNIHRELRPFYKSWILWTRSLLILFPTNQVTYNLCVMEDSFYGQAINDSTEVK
mgnify:CR=1 FL=1